jgi:hypothetical protein
MEEELEDGDETNGFTNGQPTYAHQSKTLEALLAIKNKRILEELTKFRVRPSFFLSKESDPFSSLCVYIDIARGARSITSSDQRFSKRQRSRA